jgi:beta-phosphoglucomutase-like phosphatase (HAD superfamily)/dTDP-glucose pyrophosphorylase
MIKLVIFDLDGVLIETKQIHFDTLNKAISMYDDTLLIEWDEHLSQYDGLKTQQKLEKLTVEKGLSLSWHQQIWNEKQRLTLEALKDIGIDNRLIDLFQELSDKNYKIACCSNSIRNTVEVVLRGLGVIHFFDLIISNEDVINSKPHPEMYWNCISRFSVTADETLILEDSPFGLLAAARTNSHVLRVGNPIEVSSENIFAKIEEVNQTAVISKPKWKDEKLNILIPMAGAGSRFEKAGYTFPKPLIDVEGEPMIKVVTSNLNLDAHYIYIVQKSHRKTYNLDTLLNLISPNCTIIEVDGITEGAACTTLLAKHYIDCDSPLILANSDQFVEWDSSEFMYKMAETSADGGIVTFRSSHPKWSFAKTDKYGIVTEVAEKNPISENATVGIYFWNKGSEYVKYAEQMILKNIRINNEFYVCPVFNEAIADGKKIRAHEIQKMWGLGTPEDLNVFLARNYA